MLAYAFSGGRKVEGDGLSCAVVIGPGAAGVALPLKRTVCLPSRAYLLYSPVPPNPSYVLHHTESEQTEILYTYYKAVSRVPISQLVFSVAIFYYVRLAPARNGV